MTPHEMVQQVKGAMGAHSDTWRVYDALRKALGNDDTLRSKALWEAFAAGALDLTRGPGWWDHLGTAVDVQPFDRVLAALALVPTLHAKHSAEQSIVRGLARGFWAIDALSEALVRTRPVDLRAHWDALPAEVQASCGAHFVLAKTWGDAPLPQPLIDGAAEGYLGYVHTEVLHAMVHERLGDDAWWDAIAAALGRPGVRAAGLDRVREALPRCNLSTLFVAMEAVAQGHDDHYRTGIALLLHTALERDPTGARTQLDGLLPAAQKALEDEKRGQQNYDSDRAHRVRRLASGLAVALASWSGPRGEIPDPRIDPLMEYELSLSDNHDLERTRTAFAALDPVRRSVCLSRGIHTTRSLAVASLAMTPPYVDALVLWVSQWSAKYGGPADNVIEALAHGGDHACEALQQALAKDVPQRLVYARALGRHPHPSAAEALVQYALTAPKAARPGCIEALVGQGAHGVTAAATLLGSKKADARELGVEVLRVLVTHADHTAAVRTLAAERASSERSAALRGALEALAEAPGGEGTGGVPEDDFEAALAALGEGVPEAERDGLRRALLDTGGQVAREKKAYGAALMPYMLAWVRATSTSNKRFEAYYPFTEVVERHFDHPLAPRIAVAAFFALGDKQNQAGKHFVRFLRLANARPLAWEELPWPERQVRHGALAAEVRARLVEALCTELPPQREYVLEWLAEGAPIEAARVFVKALADSAKGLRELAVKVLTEVVPPDEALAAKVAVQLADKAKTTRLAAAMVLASWRLPSVASAVQKALAVEKQPEVAAELQRALPPAAAPATTAVAEVSATATEAQPATTEAAPVAASAGAPGEGETEAALDARLAGLKAPKTPKWLAVGALPPLRWRGGTALSEGATRWFLGWLAQESETRHDAELMAVRARVDDADCSALCDGIREQWRAGGSAKGAMEFVLAQQAVLGSEARLFELGSVQQNWYDAKSYKANQLAMLVLARHGGYSALAWLEHWAARARGGQFTKAVTAAAEAVSATHGATQKAPLEELVDAAVPTVGVAADLVTWHRDRWELAMIVGRRYPLALWRAHFVEHPLLQEAARAVVFRAVETGAVFRVDATQGPRDVVGAAVSLDGVATVEIVHPVSLPEAESDAWRAVLKGTLGLSGVPLGPFGQWSRKVFRTPAGVSDPFAARLGQGVEVNARTLVQRLRAERFEPGDLIDGGSYGKGVRRVSRHWRLEIHHDGIAAQTSAMGPREKVHVRSVSLRRGDEWVEPQEAPQGLVSEAMVLLEAML